MTEAQRKADARNKKNNAVPVLIRLYKSTDAELIAWLDTVENKQGLIKELLYEAMKKKGKKMKHYGSENTHLKLTGKAFDNYTNSDPLDIYERETDKGLRYNITGIIEMNDLTEKELIDILVSM